MSAEKAEMIDVHEWEAEESKEDRKTIRDLMITKLERSAENNGGNKVYVRGMLKKGATETRKRRCNGAYVWYSIWQDPLEDNTNFFSDESEFNDRSPNWQKLMATAIGDSGTIERKTVSYTHLTLPTKRIV